MGYNYVPTKSGRALGVGMWITWVGGCLFSFVDGIGWSFVISAAVGVGVAVTWFTGLLIADIVKWLTAGATHAMRPETRAERQRQ